MRSPRLPVRFNVYPEHAAPQLFVRRPREALKPDDRLVLLEFRKEDRNLLIVEVHR